MIFIETILAGAYIIEPERHEDERGYFARTFCQREFSALGLKPVVVQANLSSNKKRGALRGMHFQYPPAAETKYVRCARGAILDVIVDLRPESPTFLHHVAVELSAENQRGLYVPERFAHGYITLMDDTETVYMVGEYYTPGVEGGLRYDDPALGIDWPVPISVISPKDSRWPPFEAIGSDLKRRMARADAPSLNGGAPPEHGQPQVHRSEMQTASHPS